MSQDTSYEVDARESRGIAGDTGETSRLGVERDSNVHTCILVCVPEAERSLDAMMQRAPPQIARAAAYHATSIVVRPLTTYSTCRHVGAIAHTIIDTSLCSRHCLQSRIQDIMQCIYLAFLSPGASIQVLNLGSMLTALRHASRYLSILLA